MADFYDIFNAKLVDFLEDLKQTFPNVPEFQFYDNITRICIMASKEKPLDIFKKNVELPFGKSIDDKDESFILSQDFSEADQAFVKMLKVIWKDLDDDNKNSVWKHVQLLLAISRKMK